MAESFMSLSETIIKDLHLTDSEASGVGAAMSWLHMHQGQVPRPTVTEAGLRDLIADAIEAAEGQWQFESDASREGRAYVDPGPRLKYVARAVLSELSDVLPKQETK